MICHKECHVRIIIPKTVLGTPVLRLLFFAQN